MDKFESEPWLECLERKDALRKLTREQLIAHLSVQGWEPAIGTREALQNGCRRVNIAERQRGLSAVYYEHYKELTRDWVKWDDIPTGRLRMMADRILEQEYKS